MKLITVRELYKNRDAYLDKALGISDTAHPSAYGNLFVKISFSFFI